MMPMHDFLKYLPYNWLFFSNFAFSNPDIRSNNHLDFDDFTEIIGVNLIIPDVAINAENGDTDFCVLKKITR